MRTEISIIMPVLNGVNYICEAIESVLKQSLSDIELIVVDAGSTDGTTAAVEKLIAEDMRVKLLHSKEKSMGYQYNIGIEEACGKYIGFVESDDYIMSDKMFEVLYSKMEKFKLDFVKANHFMFVESYGVKKFLEIEQGRRLFRGKNLYDRVICPTDFPDILLHDANHWKGIYRAEFLRENNIKFNTTPAASYQDIGFIQQTLVCAKKCMYIKDFFYCYRRDNISCSTVSPRGIKYAYDELVYILKMVEDKDNKDFFLKAIFKRAFRMFFAQMEKITHYDDCAEDVKIAIGDYLGLLKKAEVSKLILREEYSADRWLEYCMAKSDVKLFANYFYYKTQCTNKMYIQFVKQIKNVSGVVLCGYGENGKFWKFFFEYNGVESIQAVCDNDKSIQGKQISEGIVLTDVETAVKKFGDRYFFIAVGNTYAKSVKEQLKENGIKEWQIIEPILPITAHRATTLYN